MKSVKIMFIVGLIYILVIFGGTALSMYLDNQFYGERIVYAENETQDDSQYHYEMMMQRKADLQHRVVFVYPDDDKKRTKLVVVHDPVWDVYCYTLQNKPYYFKTGLNCFPRWMLEGGNGK